VDSDRVIYSILLDSDDTESWSTFGLVLDAVGHEFLCYSANRGITCWIQNGGRVDGRNRFVC